MKTGWFRIANQKFVLEGILYYNVPDEAKVLKITLNDMAIQIFPVKNAYRQQKTYMKYHLFIAS